MDNELHSLKLRMEAVERQVEAFVRSDVYNAYSEKLVVQIGQMKEAIEGLQETQRWQSRTLVLWALGMLLTLSLGVASLLG